MDDTGINALNEMQRLNKLYQDGEIPKDKFEEMFAVQHNIYQKFILHSGAKGKLFDIDQQQP